jgi:hypothetical protein
MIFKCSLKKRAAKVGRVNGKAQAALQKFERVLAKWHKVDWIWIV